ncbi:hypothetical protein ID858_11680 [Xenorhabdus sp. DI]|uniref:hypothetical protein n=1 Tax=Xenorhabdus doucetiae TaxID=351671 RepID=UPI0019CF344B|nr:MULTISPECIES: hypothetical protein [unclassified Xenorhabdus]MBD2785779.1 hypothetical protein [Xenorhabdus sp. 3]MBD2789168.1 hypothetical protein [Xenorhabdus sp. DI]
MNVKKFQYIYCIFLYGIIFFPGLLMVLFGSIGSNYLGIITTSILIIILSLALGINKLSITDELLFLVFLVIVFLIIHFIFTFFLFDNEINVQNIKSILSLISLIIIVFASFFVITSINELDDDYFVKIINKIFYTLILLGIFISLKIALGYQESKSMIFFTEPSHYALITSVFFSYKIRMDKRNIFYAIPLLIIALLIENLTLIVGVFLSITFIFIRIRYLISILLFIIVLYSVLAGVSDSDKFNYYTQRIDISTQSSNTSTLTLISGYEQILLSIYDTFGIGYGLQKMGYLNPRGEIADIINSLRGGYSDSNLHDGGLFLSKIIVEFGFFGVIFFAFTLSLIKRFYYNEDKKIMFFCSVLYISIIYFLMRGSGYFTPSSILLFLSLLFLTQNKILSSISKYRK